MSQQTLPCTPPLPELPRVGSFFSYRCLVFPKKVLKGNPEYSYSDLKIQKRVFSAYMHSNQILMNLTLFDQIE